MSKKNIVFTGGGSGGHVMPALTLIKNINKDREYQISYIGGINSIERELVKDYELSYYPIHTGKLRRYLSWENLKDIFKVFLGILDAFMVLMKFSAKDTLVFSTGGFVSVPVVLAAKVQGKKIFIHEQTSRVGLANKICSKLASKVFISFEESFKFFDKEKTFYSGYPLRQECFESTINQTTIEGIAINNQTSPILFVTGGGNGSQLINKLIERNLSVLTERFFIVHQTGKTFIEEYRKHKSDSYLPIPFVGPEMVDLYKLAHVTIARSGAGTVCELLAIGKKSIFIPLRIAQKNEQYYNALEAKNKLGSIIIEEKDLSDEVFLKALHDIGEMNSRQNAATGNGLTYLAREIKQFFN